MKNMSNLLCCDENLDRKSPDLWPERLPGFREFVSNTPQLLESNKEVPEWLNGLDQEDVDLLWSLGRLSSNQILEKIKELYNLAFELDIEEEKEMTRVLQRDEMDDMLAILKDSNPMSIYNENLFTLFEYISTKTPISSLLNNLDNMLEGGFYTGRMYQIYGEAGSGKTQLCLQLCCTVQMPKLKDNNRSSVIYIDTENSFKSERFIEMAKATFKKNEFLDHNEKLDLYIKNMTENLFIFKCIEPQELNTIVIHQLENEILHKKPKLIILDSIAYQFRYGNDEFIHFKRKMLIQLSQKLKYLAFKYDLCIICTNQITFDLEKGQISPSLGYYWNNSLFANIRFSKVHSNIRSIKGEKSFYKKNRVYFKIEKDGIKDLNDLSILDRSALEFEANKNEDELEMIFTQQAKLLNDLY